VPAETGSRAEEAQPAIPRVATTRESGKIRDLKNMADLPRPELSGRWKG
jgi:hypothetical protein